MESVIIFIVVGVLAATTHAVIGLTLTAAHILGAFWANVVAFSCAFVVSYFGHKTFSFKSSAQHSQALPRFLVTAIVGLSLNQIIVYVLVYHLMIPYHFALLCVFATVPPLVYVLSKTWAFPEQ